MDNFIDLLESNMGHVKNFEDNFDHVQEGQDPEFVTICCSDSRVLQDHMWENQHPGRIFTCGNIGNRVYQKTENGLKVSGDVLYPVKHTKTNTIVVVGHTSCGAVTATYKDLKEGLNEPEGIKHCVNLLKENIKHGMKKLPENLSEEEKINYLVEYNVDKQVEFLTESDEIPENENIVGAVYDFQDAYSGDRGQVHVINVNGKTDPKKITQEHPELKERVERLWT